MNTQQAKRIPLADILSRLGYEPTKQVKGEFWYCSPFRHETVPSFKINPERNVWYDFGAGAGGNVLDFVMTYHQIGTIAEALAWLAACDQPTHPPCPRGTAAPAPHPPARPRAQPAATLPNAVITPLHHRALTTYLAGRGIPCDLACRYLEEIHYRRAGKAYFALAFRNASDGFEVRNPYFKGTHGAKDITLVPGAAPAPRPLVVFEGFMDFLSAQVAGILAPPLPPAMVMNSTALNDKVLAAIRESGPTRVELYLDHDQSGRASTAFLTQHLAGVEVVDCAELYRGHNDVNDYLRAARPAQTRAVGP